LIDRIKQKNGVTVMSEYLPYVQSAAIGVWVLAGAVDEAPAPASSAANVPSFHGNQPGIAHFIEHMLFKGTHTRSAREIAEAIDRTGGSINAFTGKEATCFYVKTLSEHVDESIDVLADILTDSVFDDVEMEKEKHVVFEEMNMIEDSPEDLGHDLLDEAVFADAALGHRIIGYRETVASVTRDDILSYLRDRYRAGNIVISVAGNFDLKAVTKKVETTFGGFSSGGNDRDLSFVPHKPVFISRAKDIEQSHIYFGKRGVKLDADDYYAFLLFNSILGGSMSSRLFQNVREEKGLAYSVYSSANSYRDDGFFLIYAAVGDGNVRVTVDAIREEIETLASGGVSEDELSKVKEQSKGTYCFSQESVSSRMFQMGKNELLLGKAFTAEEIVGGIDAVSRSDIAAIAERCARIEEYSTVIIGKKELGKNDVGIE
jgi:predicted Zn-dependent peptidase